MARIMNTGGNFIDEQIMPGIKQLKTNATDVIDRIQ